MQALRALLDDIDRALARGLPAGIAPLAAFDADGTLWSGDVGETAFLRGYLEGVILEETVRGPIAAWARGWGLTLDDDPARAFAALGALCERDRILEAPPPKLAFDEARQDLYAMQAWAYAGRTAAEVEAYGERLFQGGLGATLHPWAAELIAALQARSIEVLVVSGSHRDLVVPGAGRLGLPRVSVHGSLPDVDEVGRFVPTPGCALYGDAKERKLRALTGGGRPLLAFGDSVEATDRALLACAEMPVAVMPKGEHLDGARRRGYRVLG